MMGSKKAEEKSEKSRRMIYWCEAGWNINPENSVKGSDNDGKTGYYFWGKIGRTRSFKDVSRFGDQDGRPIEV